jgi:hypothetical protein
MTGYIGLMVYRRVSLFGLHVPRTGSSVIWKSKPTGGILVIYMHLICVWCVHFILLVYFDYDISIHVRVEIRDL